jgi:hypothetical protein
LGNLGAHHSREKKISCCCNFCTWAGFLFSSHLSSLPLVIMSFLFSISQCHVSSCSNRNSGHRVLSSHLPEILSGSSHTYLNPQLDIHEVSREYWQLGTAIHQEGDGLILFLVLTRSQPAVSCCVCVGFVGLTQSLHSN